MAEYQAKTFCTYPLCLCVGHCKAVPKIENAAYRNERESARPPNEPESKGPTDPTNRLDRAEIVQEIRELDSLRMEHASKELADLCYHRINELLEMLDHDE